MVNHPKFFGWESFGMVRFDLWIPSSWSNEDIAFIVFMSTPLGGGYIIFAFFAVRCPMSDVRRPASGVRCPASRMVSAHLKEKY